jgi:hypothetical protein
MVAGLSLSPNEGLIFRLALVLLTIGWHWLEPWLQDRFPWAWWPIQQLRRLRERLARILRQCMSRPLKRWSWGRELLEELQQLSD